NHLSGARILLVADVSMRARLLMGLVAIGCAEGASVPPDAPVTETDAAGGSPADFPDAGISRQEALDRVRRSITGLREGWRFRADPQGCGSANGWADPAFDDSAWPVLQAGQPWEEQGYAGYDGVAWYRKRVDVPAEWRGSLVRLIADGVDDEYDLYVNGQLV